MRLCIENLPLEVTERALYQLFVAFGCITLVDIRRTRNGRSEGVAYVDIKKDYDGNTAINKLDTINFMNRFLRVYEIQNGS
ncbi:MAG: hypothetical protein QM743_00635 [Chitinophagaceae bacterium]